MLTDETGNLIGKYEYDAFGQILVQPEGTDNRFTFTGREYDKDSGLYFYRARYYEPSVGRFLTRDPLLKTISTSPPAGCGVGRGGIDIYNPSDLHPYVYVRNNPVNLVDPTGMVCKDPARCEVECKAECREAHRRCEDLNQDTKLNCFIFLISCEGACRKACHE